jgi:hypothetical protein
VRTNGGFGLSAFTSDQIFVIVLVGYPFVSSMTAGRVSPMTAKYSVDSVPPFDPMLDCNPPSSVWTLPSNVEPPSLLPPQFVGGAWHFCVCSSHHHPP